MITQSRAKELFDYQNGDLIWKIARRGRNKIKAGSIAGFYGGNGYKSIGVDGKVYLAHRLIFLWNYGYMPKIIDHIDRNPKNNCIENLREATQSQNIINSKKSIANTSGYRGVYWHTQLKKWQAKIGINGKDKHLGLFNDPQKAYETYCEAAKQQFGDFAKT